MQLLFIKLSAGSKIINAICWTLIHSLWQGLLLAVAAGIVILLTKKHSASLRYNLLSGLFLLFMITACLTFILKVNHNTRQAGPGSAAITRVKIQSHSASQMHHTFREFSDSVTRQLILCFDKYAAFIFSIWFIIFTVRLVKLFSGLRYIHYISHHQLSAPSLLWQQRLKELKEQLKISKPVMLMESGIINIPVVVGWLKPVILFPLELLTTLDSQQLEAILLHELAHVKRRDYCINLAQSFAEMIFFFNPAVLWLSSLIREERENCCDDIAISVTKSRTTFIDALLAFYEYHRAPGCAMAFPGRKNQLFNRVQRIISGANNTVNAKEKACMLFCCVIIGLLSTAIIPLKVSTGMPPGVAAGAQRLISTASAKQSGANKNLTQLVASATSGRTLKKSLPQKDPDQENGPGSSISSALSSDSANQTSSIQRSATIPARYKDVVLSSSDIVPTTNIKIAADVRTDLSYKFKVKNLSHFSTSINLLKDHKPLRYVLTRVAAVGMKLKFNISSPNYKPDTSIITRHHQHASPDPQSNPAANPVNAAVVEAKLDFQINY